MGFAIGVEFENVMLKETHSEHYKFNDKYGYDGYLYHLVVLIVMHALRSAGTFD